MGKTAGAAKKAVKALAPFDKLNVLGKNDSGDSGGGNGGVGGVGDMFETVEIPSKIGDLANIIKDAWKNADFTEIGAIIGAKLKTALDSIDWNPIKETAAKIGKSIGTLINGFVEVEGLADSIGRTIGEAVNIGITGINAFLDNTHWDSVGKFIGEGLNGIVNAVDWEGLGHLFAAKWNAVFETVGNAAATFDWSNFGSKLATSVNTFIKNFNWEENGVHFSTLAKGILDSLITATEEINWGQLGENIANFLNAVDWEGIFDRIGTFAADIVNAVSNLIVNFSDGFDWSGFGESVGNGINEFLTKTDWKKFGEGAGKFVSGLFESIKSFIDETDWKELGSSITTAIGSFLGNIDWVTVGGTISSFAVGILEFLTGLIQGVDWSEVPQGIIDGILDFFSNLDYAGVFGSVGELIGSAVAAGIDLLKALGNILADAWDKVVDYFKGYIEDSGGNIVLGLLNGISNAIKGVGKWIKENICDPFIKGFKSAFGIHSPSTVMKEQGGYIISGLLKGLEDNIGSVLSWLKKLPVWFKEKFDRARENAYKAFETIGSWFGDRWSDITTALSNVASWFKEKFDRAKENVHGAFKSIGSWFGSRYADIQNAFKNITSWFKERFDKAYANAKNAFSNAKSAFSDIWANITGAFGDIVGWFREKFSAAWQAVTGVFSNVKEFMVNVGKNIVNGIIEGIMAIWSTLIDMANKIKELFNIKVNVSGASAVGGAFGGALGGMGKAAPYAAQAVAYSPAMASVSNMQIPQLADGAVIRGGNPFLAVLGDQGVGQTNVEAPLSTIKHASKEAVLEVFSELGVHTRNGRNFGNEKFVFQVDGKTFFEITRKEAQQYFKRTGRSAFPF